MSDFGYRCYARSFPLTGYNYGAERKVEQFCQRRIEKRSSNL